MGREATIARHRTKDPRPKGNARPFSKLTEAEQDAYAAEETLKTEPLQPIPEEVLDEEDDTEFPTIIDRVASIKSRTKAARGEAVEILERAKRRLKEG